MCGKTDPRLFYGYVVSSYDSSYDVRIRGTIPFCKKEVNHFSRSHGQMSGGRRERVKMQWISFTLQ